MPCACNVREGAMLSGSESFLDGPGKALVQSPRQGMNDIPRGSNWSAIVELGLLKKTNKQIVLGAIIP